MPGEYISEILDSRSSLDDRTEPVSKLGHDRDKYTQKKHNDTVRNNTHLNTVKLIDHKTRIDQDSQRAEDSTANTAFPCLLRGDVRNYLVLAESYTREICKCIRCPGGEKPDDHIKPAVRQEKHGQIETEQRERYIKYHSAGKDAVQERFLVIGSYKRQIDPAGHGIHTDDYKVQRHRVFDLELEYKSADDDQRRKNHTDYQEQP